MQVKILNRWNASVIFECEVADDEPMKLRFAVQLAVSKRVSLRAANLQDANLQAANLRDANLRAANLQDANLQAANLQDANLQAANLRAANLQDANLRAANLRAANLQDANLDPIQSDFWSVLSSEPLAVRGLRQALIDGKVNGSCYESECRQGCLVGTMAYVLNKPHDQLDVLKPNASRPAEMFFLGIRPGDTPENSQHAKLAVEWIDTWGKKRGHH